MIVNIPTRLDQIDRWIRRISLIGAFIFLPLLIFVRVFEIYTRNIINQPSSLYNAMEREVFVVFIFLTFGAAYVSDGHVRVDVLRGRFSPRVKAWIETLGAIFLVLPLTAIVFWFGWDMVASAIKHGERSAIFFGASMRWFILATLPFGVALYAAAVLSRMTRNILYLKGAIAMPEMLK
jgi:TRAP-type mannitol/chloroaromatic compound transport system permease small subunit